MACHFVGSVLRNLKINYICTSATVNYCTEITRMSSLDCLPKEVKCLIDKAREIIPPLDHAKHKGESGRIGVIGGSLEYTGAPYFSAISALKVGADLVHVFCQKAAAPVIKSYSPELIVHPLLDCENASQQIEPWLERIHVLVIGPGLGREEGVMNTVVELIKFCRKTSKPLVIDADGLHIITQNNDVIKGYKNAILTPNAIEFSRLFGSEGNIMDKVKKLGDGVTVLEKGRNDKIYMPRTSEISVLPPGGSARRCGGQGDLLSGALATMYFWALQAKHPNPEFIASFAAGFLTKQCNAYAFQKYGRSTVCSDMIEEIHNVFKSFFEIN